MSSSEELSGIEFHNFKIYGHFKDPSAASTVCPHCGSSGVFTLRLQGPTMSECSIKTGSCPKCSRTVSFVLAFERGPDEQTWQLTDAETFPRTKSKKSTITLPEGFPARLANAIRDTEKTFEAGMYSPCLTSGRRALEGIFKTLAYEADADKSLYKLIELVLASEEAGQPLKDLSHSIREAGNIGAHFDEVFEPNRETAELLLELLEYLVAYFFMLPKKIEALSKSKLTEA